MVVALLVENVGSIKEIKLKNQVDSEYYKLVGLKKDKDFSLRTNWKVKLNKEYDIHLYAKNTGRAGNENKYEFPPPIESELYFGKCLLINKINNKVVDLTENEWEDIYNYLFGGFDDVEDSEEEEEEDDDIELTKEGYEKDGFIVDDVDEEDEDDDDSESDEFEDNEEEDDEEELELDDEDNEEFEEEISKVKKDTKMKKTKVNKMQPEKKSNILIMMKN